MTCLLPRVNRPCDECPWRADARPGRFTAERWAALADTADVGSGSAPMGAPMFACHKTGEGRDRACAGLAVEGAGHVGVRLAVIVGWLPSLSLTPGEGWPSLHPSLAAAAAHDLGGVE